MSETHPTITKKTCPDIIDQHFIKTQRAKRTFDDICYGLCRDHWIVHEVAISSRSRDVERTILISDVLPRYSITPEKCTCPWIALEYRHDDSLEMCMC